MGKKADQEVKVEVLIIGCGAAGITAAIEACEQGADVLMVTKGLVGKSGDTIMMGAGIQAALGHSDPRDNPTVHMEDIIRAGAYLNDQKLVERLVNLAPSEVLKLDKWGAKFVKKGDKFYQIAPPGSTYPRCLDLEGGRGGPQLNKAFKSQLKRLGTKMMEEVYITSLLTSDGHVSGAYGFSIRSGDFILFKAKNTILATGGCPQIFRQTDASLEVTGDGMIMAHRAGAELMDMEFQQFFPYACYWPTAFRMAGFPCDLRYNLHAKLLNIEGETFMERYEYLAEERGLSGLRDPTSRAVSLENKAGRGSLHGGAFLDVSYLPENLIDAQLKKVKATTAIERIKKIGIDIRRQAVEVGPASHYSMGGVRVNENCETTVPRLYAAGEVACGMDGAERIDGGSAIMWCITMGYLAGHETSIKAKELNWLEIDMDQVQREKERVNAIWERKKGVRGCEIINRIKDIMWERCSLIKDKKEMEEGLKAIEKMKSEDLPKICVPGPSRIYNRGWTEALEATVMLDVAEMVIKASLMREESRGSHYRTDFPNRDDTSWLKNIVIGRKNDKLVFNQIDPIMTRFKPSVKEVEE